MRHEYDKVEHFSVKKMTLPFLGEKSHMENNKKRTWISLIPYVKIHFWCRDVLDLAYAGRIPSCTSFPSQLCVPFTLIADNWARWECLHFGNWQILQIRPLVVFWDPIFQSPLLLETNHTRHESEDSMKIFLSIILEVVEKGFYTIQNIF